MEDFALNCLRGVRNSDWMIKDWDGVRGVAFEPNYKTAEQRQDKAAETSINWEDDNSVLSFTLRDRNNAAYGVVKIARQSIDAANLLPILKSFDAQKVVYYERSPLKNNPHHGNIVFSSSLPRPLINMIASFLATQVVEYTKQP